MAIKGFKKIEDTKGYKLDSKDRQIFERELKESLFGNASTTWNIYGNTDLIEFVLYDSNDNQLPQGDSGHLVRYIALDDTNIQKYFRISEDIDDIKANGAKEFLVDTEILIREAGYSNGIFKTQITLIKRRAGSERIPFDRLWIHEISPSRTEIRVLPVNRDKGGVLPDLQERYNVFINDGDFRDDTIAFVQQYVENVNVQRVFEQFLKIKGKVTEGQNYVNLVKKEFGINDFGKFILDIKILFVKAMKYWVENRDSNINSITFGNPLNTRPPVQLSVEEIIRKASMTLTDVIDKLLNKRDILEKAQLSQEDQVTFDEVEQLLQQTYSDGVYESNIPPSIAAQIRGCTDPNAENYNPEATVDDGSCIYPLPPIEIPVEPEEEIESTPQPDPTEDAITNPEPSPTLTPTVQIKTTKYYVWSAEGEILYRTPDNVAHSWGGIEYDSVELTYIVPLRLVGDIRTYPKIKVASTDNNVICNDPLAINYGQRGVCKYTPVVIADYDRDTRRFGTVEEDTIVRYPITLPMRQYGDFTVRPPEDIL